MKNHLLLTIMFALIGLNINAQTWTSVGNTGNVYASSFAVYNGELYADALFK